MVSVPKPLRGLPTAAELSVLLALACALALLRGDGLRRFTQGQRRKTHEEVHRDMAKNEKKGKKGSKDAKATPTPPKEEAPVPTGLSQSAGVLFGLAGLAFAGTLMAPIPAVAKRWHVFMSTAQAVIKNSNFDDSAKGGPISIAANAYLSQPTLHSAALTIILGSCCLVVAFRAYGLRKSLLQTGLPLIGGLGLGGFITVVSTCAGTIVPIVASASTGGGGAASTALVWPSADTVLTVLPVGMLAAATIVQATCQSKQKEPNQSMDHFVALMCVHYMVRMAQHQDTLMSGDASAVLALKAVKLADVVAGSAVLALCAPFMLGYIVRRKWVVLVATVIVTAAVVIEVPDKVHIQVRGILHLLAIMAPVFLGGAPGLVSGMLFVSCANAVHGSVPDYLKMT